MLVKNPVRYAMIGGGEGAFIGPVHRTAAAIAGNCQLVAGALSSDADRARRSGEAIGLAPDRSYTSFADLIAGEKDRPDGAEFIAIVTPNHVHAPAAIAALEAGFPVLCDKPLTDALQAAFDIEAAAQRTGGMLGVTHTYNAYPMARQARELITGGKYGPVRRVSVKYTQGWLAKAEDGVGKQAEWRTDPKRSGLAGAFGDIGTHAFNLVEFMTGDTVTKLAADMAKYKFGSILAGGNSAPNNQDITSTGADWLKLADAFWDAANGAQWSGDKIPPIFGIDAVHGHANIPGATIFPQNVGLGAMRDPDIIEKIGEITAKEMTVTGLEWDFSPTIAVGRDDRWGRSYESFSENPEVVRAYSPRMILGLQGHPGTPSFMGPGRVVGTVKHFVGDGGTDGGKDQGDNLSTPEQLRDIHGAGYPPAIEAGVQSVMASFSLVRGEKVHGSKELLTDILKGDMSFNGFVVGDWNAHGQVPGCTNESCPQSINAGLDMYMAPDSWKGLYENTLAQVKSGVIPMSRLDDAVRRILRVKIRAGLFEKPKPSARPFGGQFNLLGAPEHRAVAREAVRKSLVLLKNSNQILPLRPQANVLVVGDGADNIAKQSGGWTLTWQGTGLKNSDFRNAQSIYSGIKDAVTAAGGRATLSADGKYSRKPDVAIVVFGEDPYAEFVGDRPRSVEFSPADKKDLALLQRLKKAGIPVVSVFLSGRPLWVNPEINASDAFVAAFLPGGEGAGVSDVLFRKADGSVNHDFTGKLAFSWPKRVDQTPLNFGDANYDPLFAYGYGLKYGQAGELAALSEDRPPNEDLPDGILFGRGTVPQGWNFGFLPGTAGQIRSIDRRAQEDARSILFPGTGRSAVAIQAPAALDFNRQFTGQLHLVMDYRVDRRPTGPVVLRMLSGSTAGADVPVTNTFRSAPVGQWQTLTLPLGCFGRGLDVTKITAPLVIETAGQLGLSVSDVKIISANSPQGQCGS